jgi:hypothetical protein
MSLFTKTILPLSAMALALALSTTAQASVVSPTSYNMLNGDSGSFPYWDGSYNGTGIVTTNHSPLTGGTGDLTDGVIATQNWFDIEVHPGTGPYVGWLDYNPTIDFFFAALTTFTSMTFYFDDSEGAGGVSQPGSVTVNGTNHLVPNNPGSAPFSFTVDLTGLATDQLNVQIFRTDSWVFLSEVTFDGQMAAVPLPAGGLLLLGALGGLTGLRRRKTTAA